MDGSACLPRPGSWPLAIASDEWRRRRMHKPLNSTWPQLMALTSPPRALTTPPTLAALASCDFHRRTVDAAPRADGLSLGAAGNPGQRLQGGARHADTLRHVLAEDRLGPLPLLGLRVAVGVEERGEAEVVVGEAVSAEAVHELLHAPVVATGHVRLGGRVVRERVRQNPSCLHLRQPLTCSAAVAHFGARRDHRIEGNGVWLNA